MQRRHSCRRKAGLLFLLTLLPLLHTSCNRSPKSGSTAVRTAVLRFENLGPDAQDAHLRLRVDWRNSTWEKFLGPGATLAASAAASFGPDGDLTLRRSL